MRSEGGSRGEGQEALGAAGHAVRPALRGQHRLLRFALDARRCAEHLESSGLSRAARYALGSIRGRDVFAAGVLQALPADPVGERLVALALALARRSGGGSASGRYAEYLTNDSLGRSCRHLARRLVEKALSPA